MTYRFDGIDDKILQSLYNKILNDDMTIVCGYNSHCKNTLALMSGREMLYYKIVKSISPKVYEYEIFVTEEFKAMLELHLL